MVIYYWFSDGRFFVHRHRAVDCLSPTQCLWSNAPWSSVRWYLVQSSNYLLILPEGYRAWNQPVNHHSHDWLILKSPKSRCGKKRKIVMFPSLGLQRGDRISTPGWRGVNPSEFLLSIKTFKRITFSESNLIGTPRLMEISSSVTKFSTE